jgi:hypothetical protein
MRLPLPTNRLVTLSVLGAVLTGVLAVGLAVPGLGMVDTDATNGATDALSADAPTPNDQFTPAVAGGDEHEEGEYEHEEDDDDDHDEDDYDDDEHEEADYDEDDYDEDDHEEDEHEDGDYAEREDDEEYAVGGGGAEGDEYPAPVTGYGDDGA